MTNQDREIWRQAFVLYDNKPTKLMNRRKSTHFLSRNLKCTRDFGQLEFLTAPTVRTLRFWKSPVIGQMIFRSPYISDKEVCKGYSRGMPRPSDKMAHWNPEPRTIGFMNPVFRTGDLPPIQLSITIRSANWRGVHGQERIYRRRNRSPQDKSPCNGCFPSNHPFQRSL